MKTCKKHLLKEKHGFHSKYLDEYCQIEMNLSERTILNKRYAFKRLFKYINKCSLNIESCRGYTVHLYKKGWSNVSIGAELKMIKAYVAYLFKRKIIKEDWSQDIILPKVTRKPLNIVSANEAEDIIIVGTNPSNYDHYIHRASKVDQRAALRFILRTGLRLSEMLHMQPKHVNFRTNCFNVISKGGNIDTLPIPNDMRNELWKRRKNDRTFPVTANTLNNTLKRGCRRLVVKEKVTVHTLRHVFCTELLKKGAPLQLVSRLMRHSTVKITDEVYSHFITEDLSHALNTFHPLINNEPGNGSDTSAVYKN